MEIAFESRYFLNGDDAPILGYTELRGAESQDVFIADDQDIPYQMVVSLSATRSIVSSQSKTAYIEIANTPLGTSSIEDHMNKIESDISEINTKIGSIDSTLTALHRSVEGVRSDGKWAIGILVVVISAIFGVMWTDIKGIDNKVYKLNEDVATIKSDVGFVKTSLENIPMKSDINIMKDDISKKLEVLIDKKDK
jgi:hypothetical protein